MKKLTTLALAGALILMAAPAALAQGQGRELRRHNRRPHACQCTKTIPGHYELKNVRVQVPGRYVNETRTVHVPGRWEIVQQQGQAQGHWQSVRKQVLVPGKWVEEPRAHYRGAAVRFRIGDVRVRLGDNPHHQRTRTAKRWIPARYETVVEQQWVPGGTTTQPVRKWIPPTTRQQTVRVWKPASWEIRTEQVYVQPRTVCTCRRAAWSVKFGW